MRRVSIDLFVLDALADDLEDLENIIGRLSREAVDGTAENEKRPLDRSQVVAALARLIRYELVEACVWSLEVEGLLPAGLGVVPEGSWNEVWFRLTERGRIRHQTWANEDFGD